MGSCSLCGNGTAFYRREHEGVTLCRGCFTDSVETRVRRTITRKRMLDPRDTVAVALSGGKDSVTLLHVLIKLERRFPLARLVALTVDEGIAGYRDEAVSISRQTCRELAVQHTVISFEELFGLTMDEIASKPNKLQPCSYCGVLRRRALNEAARRLGAAKLATAHNLDDEVQTGLLNIMHGGTDRILRSPGTAMKTHPGLVARVKPLAEVSERETTLYAYLTESPFQSIPCPHGADALRGDIRTMLNRFELKHPGIKHTIYNSIQRLSDSDRRIGARGFRTCSVCGEPTPNKTCEACIMLQTLNSTRDTDHNLSQRRQPERNTAG